MSSLQEQARALGDPTRHRIFQYLGVAEDPVGIAELTQHLQLNHNAVRQHLSKLVAAGLIAEARAHRGGPGRPHLVYRVAAEAQHRWGDMGPYERLSMLLTEMIRTGDTALEVGRRAGLEYRDATPAEDDVVSVLSDTMARLGFSPQVKRSGRKADVVLAHCPFATAVLTDADTICTLHLGIARGLVEGSDMRVEELVAKDPRRAQCRLKLASAGSGERAARRPAGLLAPVPSPPARA